jgi:benzoyl-CoA 2,3-dioxygenase component B
MSQEDSLIEDRESLDNDKFVEVNYDDAIPNNVDLSSDR